MAVNTYLLNLEVDRSKITNGYHSFEEKINEVLGEYVSGLTVVSSSRMDDGGFLTLCTGHRESFATVRAFPEGTVTVNIEHYKKENDDELISWALFKSMLGKIAAAVDGSLHRHRFPVIKRGSVKRYFLTSDKRLIELDIDEVLFEEQSPYQRVQVLHSCSLGNVLILDGRTNLAVRDTIFTRTLMQQGKETYNGKEILVLGGGAGALLHELLKENPKSITMVEHDETVIQACRTHMREVNGGVLDNLKGRNYEVIIGDCMEYLNILLKQGRKFDYVFGDLTNFVYGEEPSALSTSRSFVRDVINLSFKVLEPTGKYMCPCTGTASSYQLKYFEDNLNALDELVDFSTDVAPVPSYMEFWQFYQIWRKVPRQ